MSTLTLKAKPLTAQAFAPYGEVIEVSEQVENFPINNGNTQRYHDLANLQTDPQGKLIVSIFRGLAHTLPLTVTTMERHPLGSQAFIPTNGNPWLVIVAPAGNPPTAQELKLFYCSGTQGINYATGVWHHPLLALNGTSDFIVIDRSGPGNNCDIIELAEPAIIKPESIQIPSQ